MTNVARAQLFEAAAALLRSPGLPPCGVTVDETTLIVTPFPGVELEALHDFWLSVNPTVTEIREVTRWAVPIRSFAFRFPGPYGGVSVRVGTFGLSHSEAAS